MTAAAPAASLGAACYVSYDRQREWEQCFAKAMGFEDLATQETSSTPTLPIRILNLMDENDSMTDDTDSSASSDSWMDNANQISASLTQMSEMIAKNRRAYVSGFGNNLTEEDASVLESTVLSFSATAANQIDSLREAIPPLSADYVHHCSGIVTSLMLRLRHEVANPMASLQKQRSRAAMGIFQHPLACRLVLRQDEKETNAWDELLEDDEDGYSSRDQRFLPQQPAPLTRTDFMAAYDSNPDELTDSLQRPPSLFQKKRESSPPPSKQAKRAEDSKKREEERRMQQQHQHDIQLQESSRQEFQREAVLLEASLQNDLDSVYQVEQRMTDITSLLSQFSALVSEQQEDIVAIHDSAVSSKENVSKGQESLVDATERTKRSKHYMATFVWSLAILLLFFNYITP